MKFEIFDSRDFKTSDWSGGTTKQLYIFPQNSDYSSLNFLYRISTASVVSEKSVFTVLPGVSRKLMILQGKITLNHDTLYSKELSVFDTDSFEGHRNTTSTGQCTDFNLMMREGAKGEISGLRLQPEQELDYKLEYCSKRLFVFVFEGFVSIDTGFDKITLKKEELLCVDDYDFSSIKINSFAESKLVFVYIFQ